MTAVFHHRSLVWLSRMLPPSLRRSDTARSWAGHPPWGMPVLGVVSSLRARPFAKPRTERHVRLPAHRRPRSRRGPPDQRADRHGRHGGLVLRAALRLTEHLWVAAR